MAAEFRYQPTANSSPKPPFAHGIAAERFNGHYAEARLSKRLQAKQRIYNLWHFYVGPIAVGMGAGGLLANKLFVEEADLLYWILVAYGAALIITPALLVHRRRNHDHRRYQQFYHAALERCIEEEQIRA